MKMSSKTLAALPLAFALSCAPRPLDMAPCRAGDLAARCGTLQRPESAGSARKLAMKVIVVPAAIHNDSPVFLLVGGPGDTVLGGAAKVAAWFADLHQHHDLVFMDQRGTGASAPIACPHALADHAHGLIVDDLWPAELVRDCRREVEAAADPTAYGFAAFADDLAALASGVGYDRIDLFALSFGTRAALSFLARHPERAREVLIVGPVPAENHTPLYFARDGQAALDHLVATCERDPQCHRWYPNFASELGEMMQRAALGQARGSSGGFELDLRPGMLGEWLRSMLYSVDHAATVPSLVHAAATGSWQRLLDDYVRYRNDFYAIDPALFLTLTCADDVRAIDPAAIVPATAGTVFGAYRVERQLAACRAWSPGRGTVTARPAANVRVLLVAGEADPVAPPVWAKRLAAILGASVVVFPNTAHGDASPCLFELVTRFFDHGDIDVACRAQTRWPGFAPP